MAAARQHEFGWASEMVLQFPDALGWRNMILAAGLDICRRFHTAQVNWGAECGQIIWLHEPVIAIEVDEIVAVPLGRQVGDVTIPMQQIERRIVFTQQIIFDDGGPYQILAAQHVEGQRKETAIQITLRCT